MPSLTEAETLPAHDLELTLTAYHEAGHVVGYLRCKERRILSATIIRDGLSLGCVDSIDHLLVRKNGDFARLPGKEAQKRMQAILIGPLAEQKYQGKPIPHDWPGICRLWDAHPVEINQLTAMIRLLYPHAWREHLTFLFRLVESDLHKPAIWHAIRVIADGLLECQTIRHHCTCRMLYDQAIADEVGQKDLLPSWVAYQQSNSEMYYPCRGHRQTSPPVAED